MAEEGTNFQRVLWASTSTKNPDYSDIKYVQELIVRNTINTMPENTIEAFLDRDKAEQLFSEDSTQEQLILSGLDEYGIMMDAVFQKRLEEGV